MNYLWDTHAWIWAANNDPQLSRRARQLLLTTEPESHAVADISLWETAMLATRGRITLNGSLERWFERAIATVTVLPITKGIAIHSVATTWAHQDPADRLIAATALEHGLTLVSKDAVITKWSGVKVLW
ncbi:MAG: type II toxin-antitoxin system VapC family toxin [Undibacterium sp.]|nr:type II toxin-antitoxin system VapC family toxin [Opitutaceae bacterium]